MARKRAVLIWSVIGIVVLLGIGLVILAGAFDRALKAIFVGPEHVYELSETPQYLTEEPAIAMAMETRHEAGLIRMPGRLFRTIALQRRMAEQTCIWCEIP